MATLDGSARPVSLGPGYTLRAPGFKGTADMRSGGFATTRSAMRGLDDGLDALDEALRNTNVTEVRQIDLALQPVAGAQGVQGGRGARGATAEAEIELEVPDAGPDDGQLVLSIDDNGAMRWHLPEPGDTGAATRGGGGGKRFRIPASVAAPSTDATDGAKGRGVLGAIGRRILKVLVYPLTDPIVGPVADFFARRWEEKHRPHRIRDFTPANYKTVQSNMLTPGDVQKLAAGKPLLLFVHGTFSTAHGGFGGLPIETMTELHRRYEGRVIAFDHPTLSADPAANIAWLRAHLPASPLQIDIVCHSRGGLVSRVLAEAPGAFGANDGNITVRRVVLGAVPNSGTLLTDPDHMVNMIDRLTTALSLLPSGPVSEILEALITLLKVIGHGGLKGLDGLASMNPTGKFLSTLNGAGGQPGEYFAIAANYEPTDRGLRALVSGAADGVADQVFGNAGNDLVVPTDGVFAKNGNARFPVPTDRLLRFDAADGVMHTSVFEQPRSAQRLLQWLN